jgi:hypothetical protein
MVGLSIATLIGGFATAMDTALGRRLDGQLARWAVWTVMAATLTELWPLLLPVAPTARAAVEEAEALRRQLSDRARMRAAAGWLERCVQLGRDAFRRGQPEVTAAGRRGDLTELLRACLPALKVLEDQAVTLRPRPPPLWTAGDATGPFSRLLSELPDGSPPPSCRAFPTTRATARWCWIRMPDWMPIRITRRANLDPAAILLRRFDPKRGHDRPVAWRHGEPPRCVGHRSARHAAATGGRDDEGHCACKRTGSAKLNNSAVVRVTAGCRHQSASACSQMN